MESPSIESKVLKLGAIAFLFCAAGTAVIAPIEISGYYKTKDFVEQLEQKTGKNTTCELVKGALSKIDAGEIGYTPLHLGVIGPKYYLEYYANNCK